MSNTEPVTARLPHPHPAPIHPKATDNRVAKAERIIAFMEANPKAFGGPVTSDRVATFSPEVWSLMNEAMDEKLPTSQMTMATVIGILRGRETAAVVDNDFTDDGDAGVAAF